MESYSIVTKTGSCETAASWQDIVQQSTGVFCPAILKNSCMQLSRIVGLHTLLQTQKKQITRVAHNVGVFKRSSRVPPQALQEADP